jgi:hypothetical protein
MNVSGDPLMSEALSILMSEVLSVHPRGILYGDDPSGVKIASALPDDGKFQNLPRAGTIVCPLMSDKIRNPLSE